MIVRYARPRDYRGEGGDRDFRLGKEYLVVGVLFSPDGRPPKVSIESDSDRTPVLLDLQLFDVVDPAVPDGWGLFDLGGSYYRLCPKQFAGEFWDRFHDGDSDAEATYAEVFGRLVDFHRKPAI